MWNYLQLMCLTVFSLYPDSPKWEYKIHERKDFFNFVHHCLTLVSQEMANSSCGGLDYFWQILSPCSSSFYGSNPYTSLTCLGHALKRQHLVSSKTRLHCLPAFPSGSSESGHQKNPPHIPLPSPACAPECDRTELPSQSVDPGVWE